MFAMPAALAADGSHPMSVDDSSDTSARRHRIASDDVAARQSVDAFSSLEDGQPNEPGQVQGQVEVSWQTRRNQPDQYSLAPEIQWTPDGGEFVRNTQIILGVPLQLGLGQVDGNGDVQFGWQQRWVRQSERLPTLATLLEIRVPSGRGSAGVDGRLSGIVAQDVGPGTGYFNLWAECVNGNNLDRGGQNIVGTDIDPGPRNFRWGTRVGYKWLINETYSLIGAYRYEASEIRGNGDINALEVSSEVHIGTRLTIGPGIAIGLDGNEETPAISAGIRILWTF